MSWTCDDIADVCAMVSLPLNHLNLIYCFVLGALPCFFYCETTQRTDI